MVITSPRPSLRCVVASFMFLAIALAASAWAAGPVADLVAEQRREGGTFERVMPFDAAGKASTDISIRQVVREGVLLALDAGALRAVRHSRPETMALALPNGSGAAVVLDLVRVDPFAPGFTAMTSAGQTIPRRALGEHYRGVVRGDEDSLAAVSFLDHEIMGLVMSQQLGHLVIGRLAGNNPTNRHVVYPVSALVPKNDFTCGTPDEGPSTTDEVISYFDATRRTEVDSFAAAALAGANVKVYVEADYDLYQSFGSSAAVASYLSGVFSQSATLYSNESIPIVMSQLYVWTAKSPYKGNSSSQLLASFQRYRSSFNGDLGHLVALRGGGGIAAGFNGFCATPRSNSECFSMLKTTYANVPTYSWTVGVFTHEMGHLMGSRHTHACVWNGNNTQIDGCSNPEGTCSRVGYPASGGTIMSYCHLISGVGINFNNGFGPQPGNVIRSRFGAASCLTP